ncbi:4-oxalomesaconate hydratase [Xanthomonas axonopodis pv. vasculorum]|nr:4-oxalomesaconate hydratase [Xanthomonas axonopodis pv. vasculorum]
MAESSDASPSCSGRHRSGACARVPLKQTIDTQCAIRAHPHIGTSTAVATCSFRPPDRPTLRAGNRWRAASAATHRPSP